MECIINYIEFNCNTYLGGLRFIAEPISEFYGDMSWVYEMFRTNIYADSKHF
jgi:hypothetical protein